MTLSNHLILCWPLLPFPSIFPSISLFQGVSSSHQVAKVLEFEQQSFPMNIQVDFLKDWLVWSLRIPLLGIIKLFSKVVTSFYIPTNNVEDFNRPFSSIVFICLIAEPFYSVWSGITYDLHFLNKLNIFSCAYWLFACFFEEITIQIFCPFSNWVFLFTVDL